MMDETPLWSTGRCVVGLNLKSAPMIESVIVEIYSCDSALAIQFVKSD